MPVSHEELVARVQVLEKHVGHLMERMDSLLDLWLEFSKACNGVDGPPLMKVGEPTLY